MSGLVRELEALRKGLEDPIRDLRKRQSEALAVALASQVYFGVCEAAKPTPVAPPSQPEFSYDSATKAILDFERALAKLKGDQWSNNYEPQLVAAIHYFAENRPKK
jgi:hypothetical protein